MITIKERDICRKPVWRWFMNSFIKFSKITNKYICMFLQKNLEENNFTIMEKGEIFSITAYR